MKLTFLKGQNKLQGSCQPNIIILRSKSKKKKSYLLSKPCITNQHIKIVIILLRARFSLFILGCNTRHNKAVVQRLKRCTSSLKIASLNPWPDGTKIWQKGSLYPEGCQSQGQIQTPAIVASELYRFRLWCLGSAVWMGWNANEWNPHWGLVRHYSNL